MCDEEDTLAHRLVLTINDYQRNIGAILTNIQAYSLVSMYIK